MSLVLKPTVVVASKNGIIIKWKHISLDYDTIDKFKYMLNWTELSRENENITMEFIEKYNMFIDFDALFKNESIYDLWKDPSMFDQLYDKYGIMFKWEVISKYYVSVDDEFVNKYYELIVWKLLVRNPNLQDSTIIAHSKKFSPGNICKYRVLSQEVIDTCFSTKQRIKYVIMYQDITEEYLRDHIDDILDICSRCHTTIRTDDYDNVHQIWGSIMKRMTLSENFVEEYKEDIDWRCVSIFIPMSEAFIERFADRVHWVKISIYQKLPERFIRKFRNSVEWDAICIHQQLSEAFMVEFKDSINWELASRYQNMSEEFIRKYHEYVQWPILLQYKTLSEDLMQEFDNYDGFDRIPFYQTISMEFIERNIDKLSLRGILVCQKLSSEFIVMCLTNTDPGSEYRFHKQYIWLYQTVPFEIAQTYLNRVAFKVHVNNKHIHVKTIRAFRKWIRKPNANIKHILYNNHVKTIMSKTKLADMSIIFTSVMSWLGIEA